jgi:hypothetical protein
VGRASVANDLQLDDEGLHLKELHSDCPIGRWDRLRVKCPRCGGPVCASVAAGGGLVGETTVCTACGLTGYVLARTRVVGVEWPDEETWDALTLLPRALAGFRRLRGFPRDRWWS